MKIVIDIPEDIYNEIKEGLYDKNLREMAIAIGNGTPIPNGHGKIADIDAIYQDICDSIEEMTKIGIIIDGEYLWGKLNDAIDNAPTIIEADSEAEESTSTRQKVRKYERRKL